MAEIKKVIQRIYNFDLSKCILEDGNEMINTEHGNEFVNTFIKRDLDKGIVVTPRDYSNGLVYKSSNNGEILNFAEWTPEIVTFTFNLYGLKKNSFYRVLVKSRNSRKYNKLVDTTEDRTLEVSLDNQELVISEDLKENLTTKECVGYFRATGIEMNLHFRIGKIYITDVIIDEVELASEEVGEKDENEFELDSGKSNIVAYGVFTPATLNDNKGRYLELERITGKGVLFFYDKVENGYIIVRDNVEDTIGSSFTNANYIVDFNCMKAPHASYVVTEVSADVATPTMKQGFIRLNILDDGKQVKYDRANGRFTIIVTKIN